MLLEEGRAAIARGAAAAADLATGSTTPEATWASAGAGAPATASGTGGAHASAAVSAAGAALWPPLSCSYFHGSEAEAQAAMEALWAACHGGQGGHSSTSVPVGAAETPGGDGDPRGSTKTREGTPTPARHGAHGGHAGHCSTIVRVGARARVRCSAGHGCRAHLLGEGPVAP